MQRTTCGTCGQDYPLNETFIVMGATLCEACAKHALSKLEAAPEEPVRRQLDPTVCLRCGRDNGETPFPEVAGLPICTSCEALLRNRPFPGWIKASFAAILVLVVGSLVWNLRFMRGYYEMRQCFAAVGRGEVNRASEWIDLAAGHVPESEPLRVLQSFYGGVRLLTEEKSAEALSRFNSCQGKLPPEYGLDTLIAHATIGVAFDAKDYDRFLALAVEMEAKNPGHPEMLAQVASAYACKYAVTGDGGFKERALAYLDKSRARAQGGPEFAEYEQRILYRLHSRDIISPQEFKQRFPNGWTPPKEP